MISQKSIQDVIEIAQVTEVIQDYVNLKRRGVNMIGLCPFHNEKTPSFTVSPSKNIYKCFGCGRGGNAVQFVMEHEQMSFPEAIRHLAGKYQIELEETRSANYDESAEREKDSLYLINEFAAKTFEQNLFETEEGKKVGLSYFKERGYLEKTIKKFRLGYTLPASKSFTDLAKTKGYTLESLIQLGLTSQKEYDFFRDRVMFPIMNLSGKIIAFGGRSLVANPRMPKYINSPESKIYNKRKILYGIHLAKPAIRKEKECILVEGYTDVISLVQSGVENVVASSGTALTEDQVRLIKRYTSNVKILYDGDTAGIKAALRGLDLILSLDMNVKVVLLPENEDPDSFLKKQGAQAFKEYIDKEAKDFILFKTDFLLSEVKGDPLRKTEALKDIVSSIAKIPDNLKRSLYIKECSNLLEVNEELLTQETNKQIKGYNRQNRLRADRENRVQPQDYQVTKKGNKRGAYDLRVLSDDFQEKDIIRILVNLGDKVYDPEKEIKVAEYIIANIADVIDAFDQPLYKRIITQVVDRIHEGMAIDHEYFRNHPDEEIQQLAVNLLLDPYTYANWEDKGLIMLSQVHPEDNFVKDSYQAILRFKLRKINKQLKQVQEKMKECNLEEEESHLILQVYKELLENRSIIAQELNTIVI